MPRDPADVRPAAPAIALALLLSLAAPAAGGAAPPLERAEAADVLAAVREPGSRAVLVNVWATWCAPCIEELPLLARLESEYASRGFRLILVSADFEEQASAAAELLHDKGIDAPSFLKAQKDDAFIEAMHEDWSGALPASFVYDGEGRLRSFFEGAATYEEFERAIRELLDEGRSPH